MNNSTAPYVFPVIPTTGMLGYQEALVVACLFRVFSEPDLEIVLIEIKNHHEEFSENLKDQRNIFAHFVSLRKIPVYSKSSGRPLDLELSLNMIAQDMTNDLLIYGNDLLLGDRYASNYLKDVVKNAKTILNDNMETVHPISNIEKSLGKMPNTAIGKLAIQAAIELERSTNKKATAKMVIEKLQSWVDGEYPELVGKTPNGVKWVTLKGIEKNFGIDACGKALEKWNKSRA